MNTVTTTGLKYRNENWPEGRVKSWLARLFSLNVRKYEPESMKRCWMAMGSKIEWTEATWNPLRGCTKISPGCKHCYAETFAERFRGVPGHPYEQGFDLRLVPEKLTEPLRWKTPRMVFVNSMSCRVREDVPDDYVVAVAKVMQLADWHTFQVLTKRAERLQKLLSTKLKFASRLQHIWWGVRHEARAYGA